MTSDCEGDRRVVERAAGADRGGLGHQKPVAGFFQHGPREDPGPAAHHHGGRQGYTEQRGEGGQVLDFWDPERVPLSGGSTPSSPFSSLSLSLDSMGPIPIIQWRHGYLRFLGICDSILSLDYHRPMGR